MKTDTALHRFSQRAVRVLLVVCTLSVVTGAPAVAWADAPMCDENAQSIAAPFPLMPSKDGELRATAPCDDSRLEWLGDAPPQDPQRQVSSQPVPRAAPVVTPDLPEPRSQRLDLPATTDVSRPGWQLGVFRPPRS